MNLVELEAQAIHLADALAGLSPAQRIARLRQEVSGKITFTTSFGPEDQAILYWLSLAQADIDVVTLDTGRLFPGDLELWAETERRFGRRIRAVYPHHDKLEELVARQGINGFYDFREARVACCHVRKVEPLNRALAGANAWITGLRGDQSTIAREWELSNSTPNAACSSSIRCSTGHGRRFWTS